MRRYGIYVGTSALALFVFALMCEAQGGGGKGGKGGFGFGFGGGGKVDPYQLLFRDDVKKELDLSTEQSEKLPAAVMKAVGEVLNDKQMKRLRQIELQKKDTAALRDTKVRSELKITDSQVKSIDQIFDDSRKELADLAKEGGFGKGSFEKIQGINKETKEKLMGVLTADQKKAWKGMLGEEFKFEQPKGFGFGKKDDKTNQ
jgi:hypothetical protein